MANKFTQSVLERQYKEAQEEKRAKKQIDASVAPVEEAPTQPDMTIVPVTPAEKPMPEAEVEPIKTSTPQIEKAPEMVETPMTVPINLDAYIIKETERVAKNKTFYLDQAVIDAVKAAAKRQRITDSKLVNDILRKVLAIGSAD